MKARYFADARLAKRAGTAPPARCEPIPHAWQAWTHTAPVPDAVGGAAKTEGEGAPTEAAVDDELLDELLPDDAPGVQGTADLA